VSSSLVEDLITTQRVSDNFLMLIPSLPFVDREGPREAFKSEVRRRNSFRWTSCFFLADAQFHMRARSGFEIWSVCEVVRGSMLQSRRGTMALEMKGLQHRGSRRLLLTGDDDGY
jgi:hypothetical protein